MMLDWNSSLPAFIVFFDFVMLLAICGLLVVLAKIYVCSTSFQDIEKWHIRRMWHRFLLIVYSLLLPFPLHIDSIVPLFLRANRANPAEQKQIRKKIAKSFKLLANRSKIMRPTLFQNVYSI